MAGAGYDHFFVFNARRPFTGEVDDVVLLVDSLQKACGLPYTALVHNTHLMHETTWDVIGEGCAAALETARRLGLPLAFTGVPESLLDEITKIDDRCDLGGGILPLAGVLTPQWVRE
jgi:hypothetical protein